MKLKQRSAWLLVSVLGMIGTCGAEPGTVASAATGRWVTESGNLEIDIAPCGQALCGTVVKVLANRSMSNPDAAMKTADSRPLLGMKILSDLTSDGEGEWRGQIYNRENGKTYDCRVEPLAGKQLKVRSYIALPLFGKTQIWRRVAAS